MARAKAKGHATKGVDDMDDDAVEEEEELRDLDVLGFRAVDKFGSSSAEEPTAATSDDIPPSFFDR